MKKLKKYLWILLIVLLTGCSDYDMSMKIEKDKSMEYTLTILSDYQNNTLTNNISVYKEKYEQYGYSVEEYNVDNKYGMIISKRFDNIDDISYGERKDEFNLLYLYTEDYDAEVENKMFNVDKGIFTNRYAANFYVDLSNLEINFNNTTVTFKVEVPNGTVSDNAMLKSEDNNTLTWNITSLGKSEIDFVFELNSYDYLYYGIAFFIIIYLFFSILSGLSNKDDDKETIKKEYNNYTGNNIDKKIENLTNNTIRNSANKNITVTKTVPNNRINQIKPIPNSNKPITNDKINDDISVLKTQVKQKKSSFAIFGNKKNNTGETVKKINDNEEFNALVDSFSTVAKDMKIEPQTYITNNNLDNNSVNKVSNNVNLENNLITNINVNSGSANSIMDWYDTTNVKANETIKSDNVVNNNDSMVSTDNEIKIDVPVIRVNNKSISVNNKKDE